MKSVLAVVFTLATFGPVLAQTTAAPPPPAGPTELQCRDGYKDGMQWTRDAFTKACADLNAQKKP